MFITDEVCPNCGEENVYINHDFMKHGYIAKCKECGHRMFLCDACMHDYDNKEMSCDWHIVRQSEHYEVGKCFRGVVFNRK